MKIRIFSKYDLILLTIILVVFSVCPFLPPLSLAIFDLPSHFVLQYAIAAVMLVPFACFEKRRLPLLITLAFICIVNVWQVTSFFSTPEAVEAGKPLKILQTNVFVFNRDTESLKRIIEEEQPDIVVGTEITEPFLKMFSGLKKEYPYQYNHPGEDFALLSKVRVNRDKILFFDRFEVPVHLFSVRYDSGDIVFLSVHTATPVASIESRDTTFKNIAAFLNRKRPERFVLLGDFNASPFCPAMKTLMKDLDLTSTRQGNGILPTWPSFLPPFLRIPIDHVLLGGDLTAIDHRLTSGIGSDHKPSIVTIAVKGRHN